ncbi:MAG: cupin domain-containing protein, partial [Fibrobacteres bacterium]|nr:cupin domain-containing protein [Fibrobacterota bacterium]
IRKETRDSSEGFNFRRVIYNNAKVVCVSGKKGSSLAHPEVHENDTEIVFVQKGRVTVTLPSGERTLSEGESIQFDALLGHTYEIVEDCEMVIVHTRKEKKF